MVKTLTVLLFVLSGWLFVQFTPLTSEADSEQFAESVNLALRRTAHHLLVAGGDSTSRIAPVQQADARTYSIRLEHGFDYEPVPRLLQQSLKLYKIDAEYNVSVLSCDDGTIQLGYSLGDITNSKVDTNTTIPCVGRWQEAGCRTLQITFPESRKTISSAGWAALFGFLLIGVSGLMWYQVTKEKSVASATDSVDKSGVVLLGQTTFNHAEQNLIVAGTNQSLTYRESKLLNLFATHPNQLLERELILKLVWEDEGITTVGRSVDVFVSRLRKLLRNDPCVQIVSVHGVGYRLEITEG